MGSVLAIDHGTKRTGFAVVDALRVAPCPLAICSAPGDSTELLEHVSGLMRERHVARLLVGLPLGADGSEGSRAADVRRFAERLAQHLRPEFGAVPVTFIDEHLTSKEADRMLVEAGYRGARRKERRDSWSALVMLTAWLEEGEPS